MDLGMRDWLTVILYGNRYSFSLEHHYIHVLAQDCGNSSALAMELPQSSAKPLILHILNIIIFIARKEPRKYAISLQNEVDIPFVFLAKNKCNLKTKPACKKSPVLNLPSVVKLYNSGKVKLDVEVSFWSNSWHLRILVLTCTITYNGDGQIFRGFWASVW